MRYVILSLVCCLCLSGCSNYDKYTKALEKVSYNNLMATNAHLRWLHEQTRKEEIEDREYKAQMQKQYMDAMTAAAKTKEKTDDVFVPIVFSLMEYKGRRNPSVTVLPRESLPTASNIKIEPPETPGQFAQRAGGTLLGIAGITLSIVDSNNDRKVMEALAARSSYHVDARDNAHVNLDSYKSGTDNTITGDSNTTGGNVYGCPSGDCLEEGTDPKPGPGTSLDTCSDEWVTSHIPGCSSCLSYYSGYCSVKP